MWLAGSRESGQMKQINTGGGTEGGRIPGFCLISKCTYGNWQVRSKQALAKDANGCRRIGGSGEGNGRSLSWWSLMLDKLRSYRFWQSRDGGFRSDGQCTRQAMPLAGAGAGAGAGTTGLLLAVIWLSGSRSCHRSRCTCQTFRFHVTVAVVASFGPVPAVRSTVHHLQSVFKVCQIRPNYSRSSSFRRCFHHPAVATQSGALCLSGCDGNPHAPRSSILVSFSRFSIPMQPEAGLVALELPIILCYFSLAQVSRLTSRELVLAGFHFDGPGLGRDISGDPWISSPAVGAVGSAVAWVLYPMRGPTYL